MDDLISLLIYVLFILGAIVTSAYQAKKRKAMKESGPLAGENDQSRTGEVKPDFGPFAEFLDRPARQPEDIDYESLEYEPSVEAGGVDSGKSATYDGMVSGEGNKVENPGFRDPNLAGDINKEGQSVFQNMFEHDENQLPEYDYENVIEDIAAGEIVSEEAAAEALLKKPQRESYDWRKAIIYYEVLKRREY